MVVTRIFLAVGLVATAASSHADMWKCEKPGESPLFTSDRNEAKRLGCTQITITPNVVSSPPAGKSATGTPTPGDFPKVAPQVQQQRDSDRRKILETELVNEERNLQVAKKELAEQESIRLGSERNAQRMLDRLEPFQKKVKLHEDNIANLKKELGNLR